MSRPKRNRTGGWLTWLGAVFLAVGAALLAWVGWQFYGTDYMSNRAAGHELSAVRALWLQQATAPASTSTGTSTQGNTKSQGSKAYRPVAGTGQSAATDTAEVRDVIALIRIPRLGADWEKPVLEGTTKAILAKGVGHYTGTAAAGQIGNFAVAGHVVTHGSVFRHLKNLRPGDLVYVETRSDIYTYAIDSSPADLTVDASDSNSLLPAPNRPGVKPTKPFITLTTCTDMFHSPRRSVGFGHLIKDQKKS